MQAASDEFLFAREEPLPAEPVTATWKILVVDDDHEVHRVTRLVLSPFVFKNRRIEIISAHSAVEARTRLMDHHDISVILLDVVMETDDAGLRLVQFVREQYANRKTRIILRTGQPGYAPELKVLLDYDINDYRSKAELTAERLLTAVAVSLRSYLDIETAEHATAQSQMDREALIAKSTFLATMSHELRTPLNAVIGNIELLKLTELTDRQIDIADSAATAAKILIDLIGDVLDLSKIESDRFEIETAACEMEAILEEVRSVLAPSARAKNLRLETYVGPGVPAELATDPHRLRQVLINLASNGVKFTSSGGVFLTARCKSRRAGVALIRLEVTDTGIGFAPDKSQIIFEAFVQADNSLSRRYGGSGLGLSISRRVVELMGGDVGCESEPGAGSRFWAEIPMAALSDPRPAPKTWRNAAVIWVGKEWDGLLRDGRPILRAETGAVAAAAAQRLWSEPGQAVAAVVAIEGRQGWADDISAVADFADVVIALLPRNAGVDTYRALHAGASLVLEAPAQLDELAFLLGGESAALG
jgi:signal transduction histidine kinase